MTLLSDQNRPAISVCTWNSKGRISPPLTADKTVVRNDRGVFLRTMQNDALALQECEAVLNLGLDYTSRPAVTNPAKSIALCSRHPFRDVVEAPTGNAIGARIEAARPFYFASIWTHGVRKSGDGFYLDLLECADRMVRFFQTEARKHSLPLVIAGDFNASPAHPLSRKNAALRKDIFDSWSAAGLESAYHRYFDVPLGGEREPTVIGRSGPRHWQYHIDYIFYDRCAFAASMARLQHNTGSDHFPLCAVLDWL